MAVAATVRMPRGPQQGGGEQESADEDAHGGNPRETRLVESTQFSRFGSRGTRDVIPRANSTSRHKEVELRCRWREVGCCWG